MTNIIRRGLKFIVRKSGLYSGVELEMLKFVSYGYLFESGWIKTFENKQIMNLEGQPIPWLSFSFNDFIIERLKKDMVVGEFGSGASTLFFSQKVSKVYSVEDNKEWHTKMTSKAPSNTSIRFIDKGEVFEKGLEPQGPIFDIIIVDGSKRFECCKEAIGLLNSKGVLVLDDTEQEYNFKTIQYLQERGFKKLDFWGISAGCFYKKCTTLFYKENNCLSI